MTALAGTVWGDLRTSHLYAIFKGQYVYFGETGNMPPARWKSHMTSDSDFVGKLKALDPIEFGKVGSPMFFVGICISMADKEPATKQKIARRAIEAELHRRFALDATPVLPATKLLSSSPAAPVGHTFEFDKVDVATAVYELIAKEYQNWRNSASSSKPIVSAQVGGGYCFLGLGDGDARRQAVSPEASITVTLAKQSTS